jgi:hypothetical protein
MHVVILQSGRSPCRAAGDAVVVGSLLLMLSTIDVRQSRLLPLLDVCPPWSKPGSREKEEFDRSDLPTSSKL